MTRRMGKAALLKNLLTWTPNSLYLRGGYYHNPAPPIFDGAFHSPATRVVGQD
jgi:hypothetical protein